jgi:hypothetical protein
MVGLLDSIRDQFRRTGESISRPNKTKKVVEDAVQSMIDGDFLVYIVGWGAHRHIGVDINDRDVSEYLKRNEMGPLFRNFNEVLAREIDRRMGTNGTEVHGDGITNRTYNIRVYPGGHRRENPYL